MEDKRYKSGIIATIIGILSNFILATTKLIIGIFSLSISIIADAINNYSDMASSLISLIGIKISAKPADEDHPFGHRRMEYISALILATIIIAIDMELIFNSIKGFIDPKDIKISTIIIIIISLTIFIKLMMGILYLKFYKKSKYLVLKASAIDSFNDCITTSIVLISMIIYHYTSFKYTDYICSTIVGLIILLSAINIIREVINPLLSEGINKELFDNIVMDIKNNPNILGIHDPICHVYGHDMIFIAMHVELDKNMSLIDAHNIIDKIEYDITNKYNVNILIHPDPADTNPIVLEIKNRINDIIKSINPELFLHDFYYDDNIISFECIKPRDKDIDEELIRTSISNEFPNHKINIKFEYGYISSKELNDIR